MSTLWKIQATGRLDSSALIKKDSAGTLATLATAEFFGSASQTQSLTLSATGGVVLAGSGVVVAAASVAAGGGVVFGGAASVSASQTQTLNVSGAGGAVCGGSGQIAASDVVSASGGAVSGGAAVVVATAVVAGSGGAVMGGSGSVFATAIVSTSGGLVAGGSAEVLSSQPQAVAIVGDGGMVCGGEAEVSASMSTPAQPVHTGGGGSYPTQWDRPAIKVAHHVGSGGIFFSGKAEIVNLAVYRASKSGLVLGGSAMVAITPGRFSSPDDTAPPMDLGNDDFDALMAILVAAA